MSQAKHQRISVQRATLDFLRSVGIDRVFGNPGSTEMGFLADWPSDIDYVLGLQEASVVGMADGYAQATRNAGFVSLHSAAGVGHALGNIYTAFRNQTPLVILAGQQARSILSLQPFLYAERAAEFPRPYVKFAVEPARAEDVPAAIATAYHIAAQPPCGPTFVSVPSDDWKAAAAPVSPRRIIAAGGPDPEAIKTRAQAIISSKRPAFVVGAAIDRAGAVDLMVDVAERAGAAVFVAPFSARCSFPESHPLFAGFLHASPHQLSETLRPHDLVVVVGAPVFTFHVEGDAAIFDGETKIVQLTEDAESAALARRADSIVGAIRPALAGLAAALPSGRKRAKPTAAAASPPSGHPIPVAYLLDRLARLMPKGAALVEEAPSHRPLIQRHMPMRGQDCFYTMASGGLGWSLPAAVGLALGRPERRTVCLIGDGSMMYSVQALWTAAQRKLPLTIVVINNGGYGAMRSFAQVLQVRGTPGIDIEGIDFAALAISMGCAATRIVHADGLDHALGTALSAQGPHLVEVIVDPAVPMLYAPKP
jgi:benzoylformate decarboxylase